MLRVAGLNLEYVSDGGRHAILRDVDLEVAPGEFFTLLGTSGCGKTTALRSIAGLEKPTGGSIAIDGVTVFDEASNVFVPPNRRDIAMVFQSYAIWPHMSVAENVGFSLEQSALSSKQRRTRIEKVIEVVGLGGYGARPATMLSGGQQQRVALARAFVKEARLLLLDEPLSNLDAQLRVEMRSEMKRIQAEFGTTSLYVTHDQEEALAMSDRIALMQGGRVVEVGTPEQLYFRPRHRFTAEFLGRMTVLKARHVKRQASSMAIETTLGKVILEAQSSVTEHPAVIAVRPEHIVLSPVATDRGGDDRWTGKILSRRFSGRLIDYEVMIADTLMAVQATSATMIEVDTEVDLTIAPHNWMVFEDREQ